MATARLEGQDPSLPEGRLPLQGRSRASYERMLAAARSLLIERGSDNFTLIDVSRAGKVSIGSIYHRFQGKEELVRAVHARLMQELSAEQRNLIAQFENDPAPFEPFTLRLFHDIAELFSRNARFLRPMMACSNTDPVIAAAGKAGYREFNGAVVALLLQRRAAFGHPDPEAAAEACFRIVYAAVARHFGLGALLPTADEVAWSQLKRDLARMCLAFLKMPDPSDIVP